MGDDGSGWITGYANVKNVVDRVGDMVVDGAYKELDSLIKDGWGACSHDWSEAIGTIAEAKEDAKGLWIKIDFHSDDDSQKIRTRCQERKARGKSIFFSIGYATLEYTEEVIEEKETRILKAIKVYEVSIVLAPANELSEADGLKQVFGAGERSPLDAKLNGALLAVADAAEHFKSHADMKDQSGRRINPEKVAKAKELHQALGELIAGCEEKRDEPLFSSESDIWLLQLDAKMAGLQS